MGKKWLVKGKRELPIFQTLSGERYEPPPNPALKSGGARKRGNNEVNAIVAKDDIIRQSIRYMSVSNDFDVSDRIRVLLDTGALGAGSNFVSEQIVPLLTAQGGAVRSVERVIVSLGGRQIITQEISFRVFVKCQSTLQISEIALTAMVIKMQYDVIIGFESIQKDEILKQLLIEGLEIEVDQSSSVSSEVIGRDLALIDGGVDHSHHRGERNLEVTARTHEKIDCKINDLSQLPVIECESVELTQSIQRICVEHKAVFSRELNKEAAQVRPMSIELT